MSLLRVGAIHVPFRWLAILSLALMPGFLLDPSTIVDAIMPLTVDALDVAESIDFGELRPNEKRTKTLQVRNLAWRRVNLRPVKVDCGCVTVKNLPLQLGARQYASAAISITAPSKPGKFSRTLLVLPRDEDQPAWTVLAIGTVTAAVWAEPSNLNLVLEMNSATEAELALRHGGGVSIDRIVPTSPAIEILDSRSMGDERKLRIRIKIDDQRRPQVGSESLQIYLVGNSNQPILTVPIRWAPAPKIAYVPQTVELPEFDEEDRIERRLRRVMAVVVPPEYSADDARLDVLVPWMRIAAKSREGSVLRLELEFLGEQMPSKFQQAILSARLPDDQVGRQLFASGDRG